MSKQKILAITAHHPPYHFGGYEIRCQEILDELFRRGHEVHVVTSKKEKLPFRSASEPRYPVARRLTLRTRPWSFIDQLTCWRATYFPGMMLTFMRELFWDLQDLSEIESIIKQFRPDVLYLGHITVLSKTLMPYLATLGMPIVFDEGGSGLIDSWFERGIWYKFVDEYQSRCSWLNSAKTLFTHLISRMSRNQLKSHWAWPAGMQINFNSALNRNNAAAKGLPLTRARIIHSGIDTGKFWFLHRARFQSPLRILAPGRVEPRKGLVDAVRLLDVLRRQGLDACLMLAGARWSGAYYSEVQKQIEDLGLNRYITCSPMIARAELIELYHRSDICFFPSTFRTGLSRIPLEAMACGCIVFSYGNEGSDEIITDRRTGYLVPQGDFDAIVTIVRELASQPELVRQITSQARHEIETMYSMQAYVDAIEQTLVSPVQRDLIT